MDGLGLPLDAEPPGQLPGGGQPLPDGVLHDGPDLQQVVPDARALVQLHVIREADIAEGAELLDLGKGIFEIGLLLLPGGGTALPFQVPAAHAVHPLGA